ncbi:S-layer homology domain-containing protein [Paenibacillus naphthalenovorans]|uniref:S-layer protein n=1 Tax=Paenibacillus naphthalenovorans TaxID=162209 RepID=A0A0U2W4S9_9BACL|nr:S-layer homology domain-containing protein [Paenibacillus naphthalenovorans]ALS20426.1 S-layer protein [Paenibacillus naphthalenovorans]
MKKRLSILLSAAMAFSMLSTAAFGAGTSKSSADFSDLKDLDASAKAKFDTMISAGIFDGVGEGRFGLKDKMNRAQFAKVAALIFGLKVDTSLKASSFSDVSADDPANGYALPYIEALRGANLTDGFAQNAYNPAGEVTKEQLAAFLIRGLNKDAEAKSTAGLNDPTVSDWAKGYAALAIRLKLMDSETDGTFGGTSAATRELLVTSSYEAKQQYIPGSRNTNEPGGGAVTLTMDMPSYDITGSTQAQVKSVLQEKTDEGWRIGAVVKLKNTSGSAVRIPDYELRAKASDGTVYVLQSSASNPHSIPPQSYVELSYMTVIEVKTELDLTDLLWIDVDQNVYPKQETLLADAPIGSIVWRGKDAVIEDSALLGNWGVTFSVPGESSALKYTASRLNRQFTGQAPTYIVQLIVENPGSYTETVPDFTLGGKAEGQTFIGKRIEQEPVTLHPGERKYLHYAVTTDLNTQLTAFYVLSPESFLKQGQSTPIVYYTGRIGFRFPSSYGTPMALPAYEFGKPIAIDSLSQAVSPQLGVSLMSLDWFENEGQSFKTAVAQLKFKNPSGSPLSVPDLTAELQNAQGILYSGTRTASSVKEVLPGMGTVVTFTFTVPLSEDAARFTFRLLEQQGQQTYKFPVAETSVAVNPPAADSTLLTFYPFELKLSSWSLSAVTMANPTTRAYTFNYKFKMDLDVHTTDEVIVDPGNPKLYMQLENSEGTRIASKVYTLAGENRLMSGSQIINFDNVSSDQLEIPVTLKIYETINTPAGDAKRLLAVLKQ